MNILRLKEVMDEKGVQGKDLAAQIGITPTTISNIVQGNNFPKPDTLVKIANALDVDIRDLFHSSKVSHQKEIFVKDEKGNYRSVGFIRE